jgi:hypothetical protein
MQLEMQKRLPGVRSAKDQHQNATAKIVVKIVVKIAIVIASIMRRRGAGLYCSYHPARGTY